MAIHRAQSPRRPFAYAALLLVLCLLCGCSADAPTLRPSAEASNDAPKTKQDFGNVRILVYGRAEDDADLFSEQQNEVFRLVSESLERQRGVRMRLSFIRSDQPFQGGDTIEDRMLVMAAAGDSPEIVFRSFPHNIEYTANTLLPYRLNDIIAEHGSNLTNFLPESYWEHCKVGDAIMGIPASRRLRPQFLTVNNTLLHDYDWQVPATFSEFEQLLAAAKAVQVQPLPHMSYENWFGLPAYFYTTLLYEAEGGELRPCYESESYLLYLQTMSRWAKNGYFESDAADTGQAPVRLFDKVSAAGDRTLIPPLAATEAEPHLQGFQFPRGQFEAYRNPEALVILADWVLSSPENYKLIVYGQHDGATTADSAGPQQSTSLRTDCFYNQEMDESIKRAEDYEYAKRMATIAAHQDRADNPVQYYKLPDSCWRFARPDTELWQALRSQMEYEGSIRYEYYRCVYEKKPVDYFRAALLEDKALIHRYIKLVTLYKQGLYDPTEDMFAPQN